MFRLGWNTEKQSYLLWVNDIPSGELPKLEDPSLECHNASNFFRLKRNLADFEATINGKKVEINCDPWTPALQQDLIDKALGTSEPIRSLEIHSVFASSKEVSNEFLHRLFSQDLHYDGLDKFSLAFAVADVANALDQ